MGKLPRVKDATGKYSAKLKLNGGWSLNSSSPSDSSSKTDCTSNGSPGFGVQGIIESLNSDGDSEDSLGDRRPPNNNNLPVCTAANRKRRKLKRSLALSLYALVLIVSYLYQPVNSLSNNKKTNVKNNNGSLGIIVDPVVNCSMPSINDFPPDLFSPEARRGGAIVIHFMVSIYLFYAMLLVCDEYFVPAVESICREMRIPSDVAGATFMAISTSAPELFTNVIGTFLTNGDLGVGTIVGSAVFNILAVGAVCGIGAGYQLTSGAGDKTNDRIGVRLEWWPLFRDSIFYVAAVGALIIILYNRRVYWTEALAMLALYALYVLVLCCNRPLKNAVEKFGGKICGSFCPDPNSKPQRISVVVGKILGANEKTPLLLKVTEGKGANFNNNKDSAFSNSMSRSFDLDHLVMSREYDIPAESLDEVLIQNALSRENSICQPIEECSSWCTCPLPPDPEKNWKSFVEFLLSWPIRVCLWLTIPDVKIPALRKYYWATLVMCVGWIGAISYVISWMVTIIGDTLSIPDSVTGLTFLAAGTSIPEVISSLIVARQGLGSMGFSNTIGSNTFDVLVCLGLPWLIKSALLTSDPSGVDFIEIHSAGLEYSAIILISALLLLIGSISANGFLLDKKIGWGCVLVYCAFITFACMLEMNVFFPVNLPPC